MLCPVLNRQLPIPALNLDPMVSDSNYYCLIDSDALVAFGQLLKKEEKHLHLAKIIVNPSAREMGYGKLFCHKLLQIADGTSCSKVILNVYRSNTSALKLYETLGFQEVVEKPSKENYQMILHSSGFYPNFS